MKEAGIRNCGSWNNGEKRKLGDMRNYDDEIKNGESWVRKRKAEV